MLFIETIIVAFSMYSAIPMPQIEWNQKNMAYALCAFPLVGLVQGLFCSLWVWGCQLLHLPAILQGAGLCVLPVLINGGIHLDGYADTWDALSSHSAPERKQEILKDPHIGSFAVLRLCCFFLIQFALWTALPNFDCIKITILFCLSRVQSALAVAVFPMSTNTGLAYTFATAAHRKQVTVILSCLAAGLALTLCFRGISGAGCVAAAVLAMICYHRMAIREFGGISGDLAGWFLQTAELWMLFALCICEFVEASL